MKQITENEIISEAKKRYPTNLDVGLAPGTKNIFAQAQKCNQEAFITCGVWLLEMIQPSDMPKNEKLTYLSTTILREGLDTDEMKFLRDWLDGYIPK